MKKKILLILLGFFIFMGSVATFPAPVHGKNQETNLHPYAVALRDYLKELEQQRDYYYEYDPDAYYLEDINGDGIKEMILGGKQFHYLYNGKLHTYDMDLDSDNPDDFLHFTKNKYLVTLPNRGDGVLVNVLKLEEGKISYVTQLIEIDYPYIRYTQDGREISQVEYKRLLEKYGLEDGYDTSRENQFDEIFAMTNTVKAMTTSSKVQVNGNPREFEAYTIDGNNYFKLRDLAQVVNNTKKNFEVEWDGAKNAINLKSNTTYTPEGGELSRGDNTPKDATPTTSKIYKDGVEVNLTAYNIQGSNFFKLRDIAEVFDISITWDNATKTIAIDTSIGYVAD